MSIDTLQLHPADNILVAVRELPAGHHITAAGATIILRQPISIGHKIAARDIPAEEKIIKWGCPIGSATRDIPAGAHVHTHNLKSDYLPTFETGAFVEAG